MATAADSKLFHLALITPEQKVLETDVFAVEFPAHDGSMGILTHRAPLVTKLGQGVLRFEPHAGQPQRWAIKGGYAQMKDNTLTILTDEAALVT